MPALPADAALPNITLNNTETTLIDLLPRNEDNGTNSAGEPSEARTIVTALSIFCIIVLSLFLGSRFKTLRRNAVMKRNLTSIFVLVLYVSALVFLICSAMMLAGQGLYNYDQCFSATWMCLIMYTVAKLIIYLFLVERIHVVRAPFVPRSRDWIYLSSLVVTSVSFFGLVVNAYLSPVITMGSDDKRCHMGIPGKASLPFLTVDICINIALTGVFAYLLRPVVKMCELNKVLGVVKAAKKRRSWASREQTNITAVQKNIRALLRKSLIGSLLVMIPTVAVQIQFYITRGNELAFICMTLCTIDVSWGTVVLHWLAFGSAKQERDLQSATQSSGTPLENNISVTSEDILFKTKSTTSPTAFVSPVKPTPGDLTHVGEPPRALLTQTTSRSLSVDVIPRPLSVNLITETDMA